MQEHTPNLGYFTTLVATTLDASTIGNIGANVVGTGTYLTSLNASNLSSGTVPLTQLSGITTSQLSASAGITSSLQNGYVWVGNSNNQNMQVATSSLVTNVNTGSLVTTASFNAFTQSTNTFTASAYELSMITFPVLI